MKSPTVRGISQTSAGLSVHQGRFSNNQMGLFPKMLNQLTLLSFSCHDIYDCSPEHFSNDFAMMWGFPCDFPKMINQLMLPSEAFSCHVIELFTRDVLK
jgi:hypothetical protein